MELLSKVLALTCSKAHMDLINDRLYCNSNFGLNCHVLIRIVSTAIIMCYLTSVHCSK